MFDKYSMFIFIYWCVQFQYIVRKMA